MYTCRSPFTFTIFVKVYAVETETGNLNCHMENLYYNNFTNMLFLNCVSPFLGVSALFSTSLPSLPERSARVMHLGLSVRASISKTIAPIDLFFLHKK